MSLSYHTLQHLFTKAFLRLEQTIQFGILATINSANSSVRLKYAVDACVCVWVCGCGCVYFPLNYELWVDTVTMLPHDDATSLLPLTMLPHYYHTLNPKP